MKFSDNAMSAILLCSYLEISGDDTLRPLSQKEWNEFLDKAVQCGQQPGVVMDQNFLKETGYSQEQIERMKRLMSRGVPLLLPWKGWRKKGLML